MNNRADPTPTRIDSGLWMDRSFWPTVVVLGLVLAVFDVTSVDLWLQDRLFDFALQRWLVDAHALWPRLVFYDGAKALVIATAVTLLVLTLGPARWRMKKGRPWVRRRDLSIALATLATGPALIAAGKATTNVFCPSEINRYGGEVAYASLCGEFPQGERPLRRGHCFPAGHASGGFALVSLAGLARAQRARFLGLGVGLAMGSVMGAYQMAKGAHFLSHTLVTALVSWIIFLLWRKLLLHVIRDKRPLLFVAGPDRAP